MHLSRFFLAAIFLVFSFFSYSQDDSCGLRISLLTCSPGEELYSSFGHTAIRVTDSIRGNDLVFNYGTFDDSNPTQFYKDFTRGLMRYALSVYPYTDFLQEYRVQKRGVIEQTLQLTCSEKNKLLYALVQNNEEENRYYDYYFKSDNCTTRAKDMIKANTGSPVVFDSILPPEHPTYRDLIHVYLHKEKQYWSKFGIDVLLGSNLDKPVTNEQAMFLPDYLMMGFDSAQVHGHPLVSSKQTVLAVTREEPEASLLTPVALFGLLLILTGAASFSKAGWAKSLLNFFDVIFFFSLGILGVLILVLWIIRVDTVCRNNLNIVWALPTHLPVAFVMLKKKEWILKYFRLTFILGLLLAACWLFLPQHFNIAVIPLLAMIILRSYFRSKKPKRLY